MFRCVRYVEPQFRPIIYMLLGLEQQVLLHLVAAK